MTVMTTLIDRLPGTLVEGIARSPLLKSIFRPVLNRVVPDDASVVTVRSGSAAGLRLEIFPRREKYYWTGLHEMHVQKELSRRLRPGMCVWDVGAHVGFFGLMAARLVGPTGEVHCFEPAPDNRERLERNVALNETDNVVIHAEAVWRESSVQLFYKHDASLMGGLRQRMPGIDGAAVKCVSLDEASVDLRRPDLVKIDTEETEVDVLAGGRELLSLPSISALVEFTTHDDVQAARKILPLSAFTFLGGRHWLIE